MNKLIFQRKRYEAVKVRILNENGNLYELQIGEYFAFGVKKAEADTTYYIYKTLNANNKVIGDGDPYYLLELTSAELDVPSGYYHYDIVLQNATEKYPCIRYEDCVITRAVIE